jgi:4a-hydroxytetrahydrobiopterin dehydratase
MAKATDAEITRHLGELPGWRREGDAICKTFDRHSFRGAIAFVGTLSELAERADHHPDIDIRYGRVKVALTTHDEHGLTGRDFALARQIEAAGAGPESESIGAPDGHGAAPTP